MISKNPFVELYVTESVSDEDFVKVFSPVLIEDSDTHALFQTGNVLLVGSEGSGKSALLNLLKPELLLAYMNTGTKWPLPDHCSRFVSAGINLTKSMIMDFGQRRLDPDHPDSHKIHGLFFADFLNYWLVEDLLSTIELLARADNNFAADYLGLNVNQNKLNEFAKYVSSLECWLGGVQPVETLIDLKKQIVDRITCYRHFLNFNSQELDPKIRKTKTSIGEPVGAIAGALKEVGIIPKDLPVIVRIDQFDELMGIEKVGGRNTLGEFREVIFKMIGRRDERVSIRIGARPYAVRPELQISGSTLALEEFRNYRTINIDHILQRKESIRGLFPKFANDVFSRRLSMAGYSLSSSKRSPIRDVFGGRISPDSRVRRYVKSGTKGVVLPDKEWPEYAKKFLHDLAVDEPLSAKLGEAWYRQQVARNTGKAKQITEKPWDTEARKWWKKERIQQALLQIAAQRRQRMIWSGDADILGLSGNNILIFLSICNFIWAEYLRSEPEIKGMPHIRSVNLQDAAINEASRHWFKKIESEKNGGDDRYRFIETVGQEFRKRLKNDARMSYPGANGFSLTMRMLDENPQIADFLNSCTAYNALTVRRHTAKSLSRGRSRKWYLCPVLSPYFQVPIAHTKEPIYAGLDDINTWLKKSEVHITQYGGRRKEANPSETE